MGAFRAFIATLALEWKNRLDGCETDARAVQRRRTQCHWLLDRTSLSVAVHILAEHRNDPELMLFLLVALTYCLPSWRNLLLAGGLEYLKEICMSFDAAEIRTKWHGTAFAKKAYNIQTSLGALVLTDSGVDGLVRFLQQWQILLGKEVWRELYTPSKDDSDR